jgi:hypothetical protein
MAKWLLYEHDDGRHAVAPSAEAATFAAGDPAWHRVGPVEVDTETRDDDLWDAAQRKLQAGETLTKQEANAYFAAGLFSPINQVYFRAGLIACREHMARFVEAQSPEIAASIRANWLPKLGPDFGPPRRMNWNELVASGDAFPVQMREDISPTLEALPIALAFLETPEPVGPVGVLGTFNDQQEKRDA